MSNITNVFDSIISQASQTIPKDTGISKAAIAPKSSQNGRYLLLDNSGSMGQRVKKKRKYEMLIAAIKAILPWHGHLVAFNSAPSMLFDIDDLEFPEGGTALHLAFNLLPSVEVPRYILVCSDGMPDDERQALQQAESLVLRFNCTIDTLFIGRDDDKSSIEFMQRLASIGSGFYQECDLRTQPQAQLKQSIVKLLNPSMTKLLNRNDDN
jgi:hypothetical protein